MMLQMHRLRMLYCWHLTGLMVAFTFPFLNHQSFKCPRQTDVLLFSAECNLILDVPLVQIPWLYSVWRRTHTCMLTTTFQNRLHRTRSWRLVGFIEAAPPPLNPVQWSCTKVLNLAAICLQARTFLCKTKMADCISSDQKNDSNSVCH